jgi:hypothetical protein
MSYFLKSGNSFRVSTKEALDLHETLPVGNYTVKFNEMGNFFYLEKIEDFTSPSRIYGNCVKHTSRIVNTFMSRPATTGVMLTGEKGSGKTLLSKNVSIELAKQDIPTIVINTSYHGDTFKQFVQSIDQPCVILFDEFEKVYDSEDQEAILTLLDGVFPSKKLFMLTCNNKWRVDQHMRNRPGRIFYMIDFKGLDSGFITEYCEENLEAKEHTSTIVSIASLFSQFNFDMLKALVEEMNRYGDTPQEALELLNAKPEFDGGSKFNIEVVHDGKEIKEHTDKFEGNPLKAGGIEIGFDTDPDSDDADYTYKVFSAETLVKLDAEKGVFVFEDKGTRVTLTRVVERTFSYYDAF